MGHSGGTPRDILRKASALIETGAEGNWEVIDGQRAAQVLDSLALDDREEYGVPTIKVDPNRGSLWDS